MPDLNSIPCRRCGYDLSGLGPAMACPECGGRVSRMRHRTLLSASPAYVRAVSRGALLVMIAAAGMFVAEVMYLLVFRLRMVFGWDLPLDWSWDMLLSVWYGLVIVFRVVGWWLLASPDPGRPRLRRLQLLVRALMVLSVAAYAASYFGRDPVTWIVSLLFAVATFVAEVLLIKRLSLEIPSKELVGWTRWTFRIGCVVYAHSIIEVASAVPFMRELGAVDLLSWTGDIGDIIFDLLTLAWYAVFFTLMLRFRRTTKRCIPPAAP